MYRAYARVRLPNGSTTDLCAGDVIGRHHTAPLRLDDPRISEMHAYLSLRRGALYLLALRGRLQVAGMPVTEVRVEAGLEVLLESDLALKVEAVELPEEVLAVSGWGSPQQVLSAPVNSLLERGDTLRIVPSWVPDAAAWVWSDGVECNTMLPGGAGVALEAGTTFTLRGQTLRFVAVTPSSAAGDHPVTRAGSLFAPIHLVVRYDTAHIHRERTEPVILSGFPARILSELALMGAPVHWSALAGQLWKGETDRTALRQRLDRNLATLRKKLRAAQVRPDLVSADGKGHYELLLAPGDQVEDQT